MKGVVSVVALMVGMLGCIHKPSIELGYSRMFPVEVADSREVTPDSGPWGRFHAENVLRFGCKIFAADNMWYTDVYAERRGEDEYKLLLSVRGSRKKAMGDCEAWMKEATKRTLEAQHGQVRK